MTKKRRVIISLQADKQLDDAYLWWARNRSQEQAGRWYRAILLRLNALSTTAVRYGLALENDRFSFEIRQMLVGRRRPTHRVLFTIDSDAINVIAVRHVSQRLLKPEDLAE